MESELRSMEEVPHDVQQKKLVRQLDFTEMLFGAPEATSFAPEASLKLMASTAIDVAVSSSSNPASIKSLYEASDSTPKKQKQCNCRNSKCLKLYCECFASGVYCNGCNCFNCSNNVENDAARRDAIETTLERNPNAFRPKIASSPHALPHTEDDAGDQSLVVKHSKGCHCKKSGCLKKYCECFQANIPCSDNCKCVDCKNFEGCKNRQSCAYSGQGNALANIQKAVIGSSNGAFGSSKYRSPASKKRKYQECLFSTAANVEYVHKVAQSPKANNGMASTFAKPFTSGPSTSEASNQANDVKTSGSLSCFTSKLTGEIINLALMASKLTYRSPLVGSIQPDYIKSLCHVLVAVSGEIAKTYTERRFQERLLKKEDQNNTTDDCSYGNNANTLVEEYGPNSEGIKIGERPISPTTLALMCDERDPILITPEKNCSSPRITFKGSMSEIYAEQERLVLTKLRDTLHDLINLGRIKEEKYVSLASRADSTCHEVSVRQDSVAEKTVSGSPELIIKKQNLSHIMGFMNSTGSIQLETKPICNQEVAAVHTETQLQQKPLDEKATSSQLEPIAYYVEANHMMQVACSIASCCETQDSTVVKTNSSLEHSDIVFEVGDDGQRETLNGVEGGFHWPPKYDVVEDGCRKTQGGPVL